MRRLFILIIFISFSWKSFSQSNQSAVDVQHYKFEIELSDLSDAITGKATITVKFLDNASEIKFDLASIDNDKGMYAFQVKEGSQVLNSNHINDVVTISLNKIAKKGEERTFEIDYMGTPKDGLIISKNKFGDRTFFADNWPNRAHQWIPCNDRPDDKATFEFIVTAPSSYQIISNGAKTEEINLSENKKRTHWKEDVPLSTKVMVIGAANFAIKQFQNSPPAVPVSAWVFAEDSTQGFYDYGVAPDIVKFFSSYIAPFPYNKLANVQSKTIFGGMENASCIFYSEESVTGDRRWEDVLAHEIAHQWFGDMASEKSFAHLWLSEGFATYLTDYYIENKYGKDSANKRLQKERQQVIEFDNTNNHPVVDSTSDLMSLLNPNSYQKGAWVLHMLRNEVGDAVFQKILQAYYEQYKGSNADTRDFESVAEKVSGKNLKWFFDEWLYQPGVPNINVQWKTQGDKLIVTVKQIGKTFQFPLEIGTNKNQPAYISFVSKPEEIFEIKMNSKAGNNFILDPNTKLLFAGTIAESK